nr:YcaO-like family protein [Kibdelosporangium sp. MJ126-NF4]CEL18553.1 hypothetical protein [Kibdelosporangium sp. MJ126-NF4]CTQ98037.1 hypothetical protein [Kibdelosporangium sp. MJ126-NF4]
MSVDARHMGRWNSSGSAAESAQIQAGERDLPLELAVDHGMAALSELGLAVELTDLGEDSGVCRCVVSRGGRSVATGFGKGFRDTARAGAVFEAFEHYISGAAGLRADSVELCSASRVAAGPLGMDCVGTILANGQDQPLACRRYRCLTDDSTTVLPVFMSCVEYAEDASADLRHQLGDYYDYSAAIRYAVNSGCASGANRTEATVHALNELIERDAWSMLLITTFIAERPEFSVIDKNSLPDGLAELVAAAERRIGKSVFLIDMTTDLGVPSIIAYARAGETVDLGCGASLSRGHAISRAVTELLQVHTFGTAEGSAESLRQKREHLRQYPPIYAASRMDFTAVLPAAPQVDFSETYSPATPAEHLDLLRQALAARGYHAYVHELHVAANGASVVSALVPGLERFMLVHLGSLVLPGPRGLAILPASAT